MRLFRFLLIVGFSTFFLNTKLAAQRSLKAERPLRAMNAAELQLALKHSRVLGSVLYLAAHPDDENTRLIAYLTKGRGYHTTYMSLTRGDGGQNLIGTEKGPDLGIVRTNELLAARNIDGAKQRFSRAIDFGYSKGPEETLDIWDRDKVLADVVRTIRMVRPDVIVTRFPGPEDGGGGHGHHTSSFLLGKEAFDLAADPNAFPEQIAEGLKPWKTRRLFWNNWFPYWRKDYDASHLLKSPRMRAVSTAVRPLAPASSAVSALSILIRRWAKKPMKTSLKASPLTGLDWRVAQPWIACLPKPNKVFLPKIQAQFFPACWKHTRNWTNSALQYGKSENRKTFAP
jgi:LmbE family N-acetylglucosaminyl deacetylase